MLVCRRDCTLERVGLACSDCGHTNIVHPHVQNPSVRACVLCELALLLKETRVTFSSPASGTNEKRAQSDET